MKRFTDAGRKALEVENLYVALTLALMLPDICGSLEDPGPGKSKKRYEAWFKKWLEPAYTRPASSTMPAEVFLSAADCYQLRCSLVHSGSSDLEGKRVVDIERFRFFDNTLNCHCNYVGGGSVNGVPQSTYLQLSASVFCRDMFEAVDKWDVSVATDDAVQAEKKKLLFIHSAGTMIGTVHFG